MESKIVSNSKLRELNSIKILNKEHKFTNKTFTIDINNYFSLDISRFQFNNKLNISCLIKTLVGHINNTDFTYKTLLKDLKLDSFLTIIDNVNFINECSLNINNKKYYDFVYENSPPPPGGGGILHKF